MDKMFVKKEINCRRIIDVEGIEKIMRKLIEVMEDDVEEERINEIEDGSIKVEWMEDFIEGGIKDWKEIENEDGRRWGKGWRKGRRGSRRCWWWSLRSWSRRMWL